MYDAEHGSRYAYSITCSTRTEGSQAMPGTAASDNKARENRARRAAERQGLTLVKSRRRDPHALGYGTYMLVNSRTGGVVAAGSEGAYGLTLDEVEDYLTRDPKGGDTKIN
jgi:hypothetical protein